MTARSLTAPPDPRFGVLYAAPFLSNLDRYAALPLLISISIDLQRSLAAVAIVMTVYFLCFGAIQPVYGFLADRMGRVPVMRSAMLGLGVADVVAAIAPSFPVLLGARAAAGACAAALVPLPIVYVGDRLPASRRQATVATIHSAAALGSVVAILGAGLLARFATWRLAFAVPAVLGLVVAAAFSRLPESRAAQRSATLAAQLRRVLGERWARFLLGYAVVEGAVMAGFLAFFPSALQAASGSPALAGLVTAAYGLAIMAGAPLVRHLVRRMAPAALLAGGGALLCLGYLAATLDQGAVGILVASVLAGGAFVSMHSTVQSWSTQVTPAARATAVTLLPAVVFSGAAAATAIGGGLASAHGYQALFLIAAALTVPVVVVGAVARARYQTRESYGMTGFPAGGHANRHGGAGARPPPGSVVSSGDR